MTLALVKTARTGAKSDPEENLELDRVFFALSDPIRRALLKRLDEGPALVSELAAPFDMTLQGVARHIQVLVRAGLVQQERTGRIARCRLDASPMYEAALWLNGYTKYWQAQFDTLAAILTDLPPASPAKPARTRTRGPHTRGKKRK